MFENYAFIMLKVIFSKKLKKKNFLVKIIFFDFPEQDSNPGPLAYHSSLLSTRPWKLVRGIKQFLVFLWFYQFGSNMLPFQVLAFSFWHFWSWTPSMCMYVTHIDKFSEAFGENRKIALRSKNAELLLSISNLKCFWMIFLSNYLVHYFWYKTQHIWIEWWRCR